MVGGGVTSGSDLDLYIVPRASSVCSLDWRVRSGFPLAFCQEGKTLQV